MARPQNIALVAGVGAVRLASNTRPPVFVSAIPIRQAVVAQPEIALPIVAAKPELIRPVMTAQIQDLKLLDPEVAARISRIPFRPPAGVERSALTAPILQGDTLAANSVLEHPQDATKKFFVMGYAVGEQVTTTGRQYSVRVAEKGQAWELSVTLARLAPSDIVAANPGAQELPGSRISLRLQYLQRVGDKPSVLADIEFTQTTVEGDVVHGVLALDNMNQRDDLWEALTDPELEAHLVVRQLVTVAVLVPEAFVPPVPSAPTNLRLELRNAALVAPLGIRATGEIHPLPEFPELPERPLPPRPLPELPPLPPTPPLYRETSRTLDLRLPFTFIKELHPYVFEAAGAVTPGASSGLVRRQVDWNGTRHFYYQSNRSRNAFYYMPDTFKLARRSEPPHQPILSASFESTDQDRSLDGLRATVTYVAVPVVSRERLTAALPTLRNFTLPELAEAPIDLEPLLPDPKGMRLRLSYPGADISTGPFAPRLQAQVDLRSAIVDSIPNLTIDQFRALYDALFSTGQLTLTGSVTFDLGSEGESIPFKLRLFDTAEPLASWTETTEGDTLVVALKNEVESPLRIHRVDAIATEAANLTVKPLTSADGTLPMELAPAASTRFSLTPASGIDILGLDLFDVETVPDRNAIYNLILDPTTRPSFMRSISVKTFPLTFAPPADAPDRQVLEIIVDFDDGNAVALTATELEQTVRVTTPVASFVLENPPRQEYRYKLTVVRANGSVTTDPEWTTGTSQFLRPAVA
jgi:hypothetical protein